MTNNTFVLADNGQYFVRKMESNYWGFSLYTEEGCFPGGHGIGARTWKSVEVSSVPTKEMRRMGWMLDTTVKF